MKCLPVDWAAITELWTKLWIARQHRRKLLKWTISFSKQVHCSHILSLLPPTVGGRLEERLKHLETLIKSGLWKIKVTYVFQQGHASYFFLGVVPLWTITVNLVLLLFSGVDLFNNYSVFYPCFVHNLKGVLTPLLARLPVFQIPVLCFFLFFWSLM